MVHSSLAASGAGAKSILGCKRASSVALAGKRGYVDEGAAMGFMQRGALGTLPPSRIAWRSG
jgi:hypothetical protein